MSFEMTRNIGFSQLAQASIIDLGAVNDYFPDRSRTEVYGYGYYRDYSKSNLPWALWGCNNLLPNDMLCDIRKTGILNAIFEGKARFAACEGITPIIAEIDAKTGKKVIKQYVNDPEINNWMEDNNMFLTVFAWIKDYVTYNRCVTRIVLNKNRDYIASIKRDDVTQHRIGKMDSRGKRSHVWFSREWWNVTGEDSNKCFKKPLLDEHNPLKDLLSRKGERQYEYALVNTHPGWDEDDYPIPGWMSNLKWIRIIQSIPEMKNALYQNSIRAQKQVIIYEDFWKNRFGDKFLKGSTAEREKMRNQIYDDIEDFLVGAKNSGKAIFTDGYRDREGRVWADIEFKEIPDQTKQGEYLPDSAAGNSEISFTTLWNNAITGGNQKNNLYSENQGGSNVREATALQVILHNVERYQVTRIMNLVKRFNGWDKRFPELEFIIPATILTTLDTGASTKGVVTGNVSTKENNNGADNNHS